MKLKIRSPHTPRLEIGRKVRSLHSDREEGIDTTIVEYNPANPIEDHGFIEFQITDPGASKYLKVGDSESYVHYLWQSHLEIIG